MTFLNIGIFKIICANFAFVKLLTAILSVYILLMVCKPCVDDEIICADDKELASSENHSHDSHDDSCSPFCICNCCSVQIVIFAQPIVYNLRSVCAVIQIPTPTDKSSFNSDFFGSIWQPPQIP